MYNFSKVFLAVYLILVSTPIYSQVSQKIAVELQEVNRNLEKISEIQSFYNNLTIKLLIIVVFFLFLNWLVSTLKESENAATQKKSEKPLVNQNKKQFHTPTKDNETKKEVSFEIKNSWDIGGASHKGNVRENNEDAISIFKVGDFQIAIIADGLGGMPKGKDASNLAVNKAKDFILGTYTQNIDYWYKNRSILPLIALHFASLQITSHAQKLEIKNSEGLRTTLIIVISDKDNYHYAYIGDGGIMCLRENGSIENIMIPQKFDNTLPNMLSASLGPVVEGTPNYGYQKKEQGDLLILGTDGVFDRIRTNQFSKYIRHSVVQKNGNLNEVVKNITAELSEEKDQNGDYIFDDNLTLAIIGTGNKPNLPKDYWKKSYSLQGDTNDQ